MNRKLLLGLTILLLSTMAASGWALWREYQIFMILRGTPNEQIALISSSGKNASLPLSARNTRRLITDCADLRQFAPLLKREPETLARFSEACETIAENLLASAPTNARALAMRLMMQREPTPSAFEHARSAAPYEPGPLQMRIHAVANMAGPSADLLEAVAPDIARALESRWGRDMLARLYLDRPDLRPFLVSVVEAAPSDLQRDFLAAVRRASEPGRLGDG